MDENNKKVVDLSHWFKFFSWNFDAIYTTIQQNLRPCGLGDYNNTFIAFYPIGNVDTTVDIKIISHVHKKTFIINSSLVIHLWLQAILFYLFAFNKNLYETIATSYTSNCTFWWDASLLQFVDIYISDLNQLIKESIVVHHQKDWKFWKWSAALSLQPIIEEKYKNIELLETSGNGISLFPKVAKEKAISEAIERLSSWYFWTWKLSSEKLLLEDNIMRLYLWASYKHKKKYWWYPIQSLYDSSIKYVPWVLLFYPFYDCPFWNGNSNWVSCHFTLELALENALLEVIERDAYALWRLLRSWSIKIIPNKKITNIIKDYTFSDYEIDLFLLYFDNPIPVVLSIARSNKKVVMSLVCWYTLVDAIKKSLSETGQFAKEHLMVGSEPQESDHIIQLHIKHYVDERNFDKMSRVYESDQRSIQECEEMFSSYKIWNCKDLLSHFHQNQTQLYLYEYTNNILSVFGRKCVRVISDNHIPIRFGYNMPSSIRFSHRVLSWQEKLWVNKLNDHIHPFW